MDEQQRKHYTNEISRLQTENDRLRRELKAKNERDVPPIAEKGKKNNAKV